ncbi:MAG: hypothetical protein NWS47_03680 [Alphaproteobacteria bacterium]|nr:hypothetical protein [Alphaproteobacteria bacterium]
MKKILIIVSMMITTAFRADCAALTETVDSSKMLTHTNIISCLEYGAIQEHNIDIIQANSIFVGAGFEDTKKYTNREASEPFDSYLFSQALSITYQSYQEELNKRIKKRNEDLASPISQLASSYQAIINQMFQRDVSSLEQITFAINASMNVLFSTSLSEKSVEDILVIKVNEITLTDEHIAVLNASPANILVLIAVNGTGDLSRLEAIVDQLSPRIKFALSDRTELGIEAAAIERIIANPKLSNLFYLALHNLSDENAARISECQNLHNLVSLSVCRSNISQVAALTLAGSMNFPVLEQFVIDKKALGGLTTDQYVEQIIFKGTLRRLDILSYDPEFKQESIIFN